MFPTVNSVRLNYITLKYDMFDIIKEKGGRMITKGIERGGEGKFKSVG